MSMQTFSQLIPVGKEKLFFTFSPLQAGGDLRFYVRVVDARGNTLLFHMERKEERWTIIDAPRVPQWIHAVELALHQAIEQGR